MAHEMGFKVIIDWVANHTGWDHTWTTTHPEYYNKDAATNDFKMPGGMEDIIELNYNNPALRKGMIDAMQFWVDECDIDGFRCDLASWVDLDFWKEARATLDYIKPLFWLGEYDELENPEYGEAFDASYSWAWMHKTEEFYKQKLPLDTLLTLLKNMMILEIVPCEHGLRPIMMRIAGTERNMISMEIWQKHWQCLVLLGMVFHFYILGRNYPTGRS